MSIIEDGTIKVKEKAKTPVMLIVTVIFLLIIIISIIFLFGVMSAIKSDIKDSQEAIIDSERIIQILGLDALEIENQTTTEPTEDQKIAEVCYPGFGGKCFEAKELTLFRDTVLDEFCVKNEKGEMLCNGPIMIREKIKW